jgi:hypothetical protein
LIDIDGRGFTCFEGNFVCRHGDRGIGQHRHRYSVYYINIVYKSQSPQKG